MTTKKTKTDQLVDTLADILQAAKVAAEAVDPGQGQDGGTCNFDTPAFYVDKVREATIEKAAIKAGVKVTKFRWFGGRWFWLHGVTNGQANRRTTMMMAAQEVLGNRMLEIHGGRAAGYFQMD